MFSSSFVCTDRRLGGLCRQHRMLLFNGQRVVDLWSLCLQIGADSSLFGHRRKQDSLLRVDPKTEEHGNEEIQKWKITERF